MDSKIFFNQLKQKIPYMEGVEIKTEGDKLNFYVDGRKELYVSSSGAVSHEMNSSFSSEKVSQMTYLALKASRDVWEYLKMIEDAPEFILDGVENNYKLLSEFNNVVFAGRVSYDGLNIEFVTWDKDSKGVSAGHYMGNNFIVAKEDFATRAGLVDTNKILSSDELVEIYRCVEDTLAGGYEITDKQEEILGEIKIKITEVVPDVIEKAIEAGEEFEREQNNGQTMS